MKIVFRILLIATAASFSWWFLVYWWLVPNVFLYSQFLADVPMVVKIVTTSLLLVFNLLCALTIERLVPMVDGMLKKKIWQKFNAINYALNIISIFVVAILLFRAIGIFLFVSSSQIPLYFGVLAIRTTLRTTKLYITGVLGSKEQLDFKRLIVPSAHDVIDADGRPLILYLRSFKKEISKVTANGLFAFMFNALCRSILHISDKRYLRKDVFPLKNILDANFLNSSRSLLDEQVILTAFFSQIGPYVSIGRPGEKFRRMDLGASKMYVADDKWQSTFLDLLERSAAILLEAGNSNGLLWEIEQIKTRAPASRLLIILPTSDVEYKTFCTFSEHVFPCLLPEERVRSRLLMFEDDWTPIELENVKYSVVESLAPFCRRNGLPLE